MALKKKKKKKLSAWIESHFPESASCVRFFDCSTPHVATLVMPVWDVGAVGIITDGYQTVSPDEGGARLGVGGVWDCLSQRSTGLFSSVFSLSFCPVCHPVWGTTPALTIIPPFLFLSTVKWVLGLMMQLGPLKVGNWQLSSLLSKSRRPTMGTKRRKRSNKWTSLKHCFFFFSSSSFPGVESGLAQRAEWNPVGREGGRGDHTERKETWRQSIWSPAVCLRIVTVCP